MVFPKVWSSIVFDPLNLQVLTNHWSKMVLKRLVEWEKCSYLCLPTWNCLSEMSLAIDCNSCLGPLCGAPFTWSGWPRSSASASSTYLQQNAPKPLVSNGRKAGITHNELQICDLLWEVRWQCWPLDCHWAPELITWVNTQHEASLISLLSGLKLERDYFYWGWVSRLRW